MDRQILNRKIKIPASDLFSPVKTFDCGQCFRFDEKDGFIEGIAGGELIRVGLKDSVGEIEYFTSGGEKTDLFFDPNNSYTQMSDSFVSAFEGRSREALEAAVSSGFGIRILKQDFFEALISFIISQNNNIPRIKKNVKTICERFGEPFSVEGETYYTFPTAAALLDAGETGLGECKLGFRVKYILDAARRVKEGSLSEEALLEADTDRARDMLCEVHGVGPKVAACVLLYGLARLDTVPIDVWMKKVFAKYFDGIPDLGIWGGVAQQYLFYNERYLL